MIAETVTRVHEADPVGGNWYVDGHKKKVWVDVSPVATAVVLKVNENVIKDSWLRLTGDTEGINLAKLNATIKGVKLALQ